MSQLEIPEFSDIARLHHATCGTERTMRMGDDGQPTEGLQLTFLPLFNDAGCIGRLAYWPDVTRQDMRQFRNTKNTAAILSSRLGRNLDSREAWFRALRATCARLAEQNCAVVNVPGSTVARFLVRATELFATPRIDCYLPQRRKSPTPEVRMAKWWKTVTAEPRTSTETSLHAVPTLQPCRVFLSPVVKIQNYELNAAEHGDAMDADFAQSLPEADLINLRLARVFYALHVRHNGNIERALLERLAKADYKVHLAIGEHLNSAKAQQRLLASGAIGWYLYQTKPVEFPPDGDSKEPKITTSVNAVHTFPSRKPTLLTSETEPFLTHCTRRRTGPWPDQSKNAYLDDLILTRTGADHSPFAALQRIVSGKKLIASDQGIRGAFSVVSFTSVRLEELKALRVFRSHRGRWDFEPYGIRIRLAALQTLAEQFQHEREFQHEDEVQHKALRLRPVQYADSDSWDQLDESERPFFQKSQTATTAGNVIDWTAEQEWRFLGDVDLSKIESDQAIVFVKTPDEAVRLRPVSPWPVRAL